MSFKGEEAFVNANWHALKKEASQKETKTDTFPKKIIVWKWRENYQECQPEKTNDFPRKTNCLRPNPSGRKGEPKARSNIDTFLHPRVQKAGIFATYSRGGLTAFQRFVDLSGPLFCKRGQFLFGPVLAVLFRSHSIMSPKLAVEVREIRKAAIVRHLSDGFVTLL